MSTKNQKISKTSESEQDEAAHLAAKLRLIADLRGKDKKFDEFCRYMEKYYDGDADKVVWFDSGRTAHVCKEHGAGNEKDSTQRGVTIEDVMLIPCIIRSRTAWRLCLARGRSSISTRLFPMGTTSLW